AAAASMDLILCTSFADDQDWGKLLALVANHGKLVLLGLPESDLKIHGFSLIGRGVSIGGSLIGGRKAVQEMFDFAAEKNIRPLIEKMPMSDANAAVKHMMEGRPRYRIVLETEAAARV
ncbi:hypothetical protein BGZ58_005361, partial [Dissophora ornata]